VQQQQQRATVFTAIRSRRLRERNGSDERDAAALRAAMRSAGLSAHGARGLRAALAECVDGSPSDRNAAVVGPVAVASASVVQATLGALVFDGASLSAWLTQAFSIMEPYLLAPSPMEPCGNEPMNPTLVGAAHDGASESVRFLLAVDPAFTQMRRRVLRRVRTRAAQGTAGAVPGAANLARLSLLGAADHVALFNIASK
jgi:hypothetical protein